MADPPAEHNVATPAAEYESDFSDVPVHTTSELTSLKFILTPPSSESSVECNDRAVHEHMYAAGNHVSEDFISLASYIRSIEDPFERFSILEKYEYLVSNDVKIRHDSIWRMELEEKLCQMAVQEGSLADMYAAVHRMERDLSRREKLILVFEAIQCVDLGELELLTEELSELEAKSQHSRITVEESLEIIVPNASQIVDQPVASEVVVGALTRGDIDANSNAVPSTEMRAIENLGNDEEIQDESSNAQDATFEEKDMSNDDGANAATDMQDTASTELMAGYLTYLHKREKPGSDSSMELDLKELFETQKDAKASVDVIGQERQRNVETYEDVEITSNAPEAQCNAETCEKIEITPIALEELIGTIVHNSGNCEEATNSDSLKLEDPKIQAPGQIQESQAAITRETEPKCLSADQTMSDSTPLSTSPPLAERSFGADDKEQPPSPSADQITFGSAIPKSPAPTERSIRPDDSEYGSDSDEDEAGGNPLGLNRLTIMEEVRLMMERVGAYGRTVKSSTEDTHVEPKPTHDGTGALASEPTAAKIHLKCNDTCRLFTQLLSIIQQNDVSPSQFCEALIDHFKSLLSLPLPNDTDQIRIQEDALCFLSGKGEMQSKALIEALVQSLDNVQERMIDSTMKVLEDNVVSMNEHQEKLDSIFDRSLSSTLDSEEEEIAVAALKEISDTSTKLKQQARADTFLAGLNDLLRFGRFVLLNVDLSEDHDSTLRKPSTLSKKKNKNKKKKNRKKEKKVEEEEGKETTPKEQQNLDDSKSQQDSELQNDSMPQISRRILLSNTIRTRTEEMISILENGRRYLIPSMNEQATAGIADETTAMQGLEVSIALLRAVASNPHTNNPADAAVVKKTLDSCQPFVDTIQSLTALSIEAESMAAQELANWLGPYMVNGQVVATEVLSDPAITMDTRLKFIAISREYNLRQAHDAMAEPDETIVDGDELPATSDELPHVFDFASYLKKGFPEEVWTFQRLPGSTTNYTVRATRQSGGKTDYKTCILKYAPPGTAAVGVRKLHDDRQEREAFALQICSIIPKDYDSGKHCVLSPNLLVEDIQNHVLIIQDLSINGTLPDALEPFRIPHSELSDLPMNDSVVHFNHIGEEIGLYFANIHSPSHKEILKERDYRRRSISRLHGTVLDVTASVEEGLQMFDHLNCHELAQRVAEDLDATFDGEFEVFSIGDATLGSILVDCPVSKDSHLGLVDWEWSGFGRGINGDMAQLFAELLTYLTAPRLTKAIKRIVQVLISSVARGYRERCRKVGSNWVMARNKNIAEFGGSKRRLPPKVARALRSLHIACGRNLILLALNPPRECLCCKPGETEDCQWIKNTVELGASCLRYAGRDEHDFQSSKNWKHVSDNLKLHNWLLELVFD